MWKLLSFLNKRLSIDWLLALLPLSSFHKGQAISITTLNPSMTLAFQSLLSLKGVAVRTFDRKLTQLCNGQKSTWKGFKGTDRTCDHILSQWSEHTHICVCESCAIWCTAMPIHLCVCSLCAMALAHTWLCVPALRNKQPLCNFWYRVSGVVNWTMRDPVSTFLEKIVQSYQESGEHRSTLTLYFLWLP